MSPKAFAGYKKEVQRLRRPPKPIVVRELGNGDFEIVDGEHGWRCACELGLTTVHCEIRDLDDFDASRECYLRNRGGKDNPVVLAQLFLDAMRQRQMSGRALAKSLGISEGKVRNILDYGKAYKLRSKCAPKTSKRDIAALNQQQARMYLAMEQELRDRWLDAGADPAVFDGIRDWTSQRVTHEIVRSKLVKYVASDPKGFGTSVRRIALLADWLDQHKHIREAQSYVAAAAEVGVPPDVMNSLPLGSDGDDAIGLISPTAWQSLLGKAKQTAGTRSGLLAEVAAGVRLALQDAGIDPAGVCSAAEAESLRVVADAPDFIQAANHLSLTEKRWLAEIPVGEGDNLILSALQMTCDALQQSRSTANNGKTRVQSDSVEAVFKDCVRELVHQKKLAADQELFDAPDELVQAVIAKLSDTQAIRDGYVGEQPAADVLHQRLNGLDWPEFFLLATCVLNSASTEDAARRWLTTMQGSLAAEVDA
jgi:hypothetical protein